MITTMAATTTITNSATTSSTGASRVGATSASKVTTTPPTYLTESSNRQEFERCSSTAALIDAFVRLQFSPST